MTRILVAEDEPAILDAVAYTLRGEGYDVQTADDGELALEEARSQDYDLMILDLMLPKLSGTEILRRVRQESPLPVIVLTAKSAETDRVLVDGEPRHLTPTEFKLLALLASQPERAFARRELMQHLWDSRYVGDQRACDIHVSNLRRKVERDATRPERIVTVRGVGYKLVVV